MAEPRDYPPAGLAVDSKPVLPADSKAKIPAEAGSTGVVAIELSFNGSRIGWLGVNGDGWSLIIENVPLYMEQYTSGGNSYYKIPEARYPYMSVNNHDYVAFYSDSDDATTFYLDGGRLFSNYNHQQLSFYSMSDRYLYCWNAYNVLEVRMVDSP